MATPRARWAATGTSNSTKRSAPRRKAVVVGVLPGAPRSSRCPGAEAGRRSPTRTKSRPVPRGPRSHLRPVAVATSQPMRPDVDRQLAHALAGVEEVGHPGPAAQQPRPPRPGLTRPRWVPTWVRPTRATGRRRPARRAKASRASRSTVPSPVLGTTSMVAAGHARTPGAAPGSGCRRRCGRPGGGGRAQPAAEEEAPQRLGPAPGCPSR